MVPGAEQRRWWLSLILVGLLVVDSLSALEPSKDPDEIALQQENVGTDTASLVAYLNSRANNDELLLKLEKHTQELGSANFKQRELATNALIRLGCVAVPQLQRALESRDQEVQKRAEHCLEAIQKQPYARSPSIAVRLLRWRQAPELVETYLGFLPYAGDAKIEEAICFGLDAHCARQKECNPHLLAALKDAVALRRAIAGCLVARYGSDLHRERARVLLRDPDSKVRLRTAQGFLASGNPIGMPVLVELLTDPSWCRRTRQNES